MLISDHINGRVLYEMSGSKRDYNSWFKETFGNSYVDGKDYAQRIVSVHSADGKCVNMIDHILLPHMAMEAALQMPGDRGHSIRSCALECMNNWGNPERVVKYAATLINKAVLNGDRSLAEEFMKLCPAIGDAHSGISYDEWVLQSDEPRTITEISHDYGLSAVRLNRILESMDIQYRVYGTWRLRPVYDAAGYVVKESHGYGDQEGAYHEGYRLKWTQKGQMFIYRLLKSLGIHPQMEANKNGQT